MLLTLSNSLLSEASLACSASYFDSPCRGAGAWVSGGWEGVLGLGFEGFEGDAKRSSGSESERSSLPMSGLDMLG